MQGQSHYVSVCIFVCVLGSCCLCVCMCVRSLSRSHQPMLLNNRQTLRYVAIITFVVAAAAVVSCTAENHSTFWAAIV